MECHSLRVSWTSVWHTPQNRMSTITSFAPGSRRSIVMGASSLLFCLALLAGARYQLKFVLAQLQTLAFVAIVFVKQATTYCGRERRSMWSSRPSAWLVGSSLLDISIASALAATGIAMTRIPASTVVTALAAAALFAVLLDTIKVPLMRRLEIR